MTSDLRQRAEALLNASPDATPVVSTADVQSLVHELQVHQIELEMQNEELRQAQIELAQSRDSYAELYDFAPVGYLTLDRNGVILEANHTAATMFGVDRGRLLRRKFSDFVQRNVQDEWFRFRYAVLGGHTPTPDTRTIELGLHRADGSPFSARLECRPRPDATAEARRSMMAVIDVTQRHAAEEELRRLNEELNQGLRQRTTELAGAEGKFRSLAEESPNMIYISCRGRVVYANPACEEATGYTRQEFYAPAFDFPAVVVPESADRLRSSYERVLAGERVTPSELTLLSRSGKRVEVIHSIKAVDYGDGKAVLGTLTDITARKKAERLSIMHHKRLQRLTAELAIAQDQEQRRIAEGLHDDVAQLLTGCSLKLALAAKIEDIQELRALHDEIDDLISEANEKVHSLSFELGSSTLCRLGLKEAVEELCEGLETRHGIHFVVESAGDTGGLDEGAALGLFKAIRELLFNVVKHAGVKEACVRMAREGDHLKLAVQDRGKGFLRPHGDAGDDLTEEGIGLLGVRERMRGLGGRMRIETEPGAGTRVTLSMPVGRSH